MAAFTSAHLLCSMEGMWVEPPVHQGGEEDERVTARWLDAQTTLGEDGGTWVGITEGQS